MITQHSRERRRFTAGSQSAAAAGFSLIELLIAMVVLTVGMLGGMVVIALAVASNANAKFDTGAVSLAQSTMDRIVVISMTATGTQLITSMTDCNGTPHAVNTTIVNKQPTGAPTATISGIANGAQAIDFTQPPVAGYQMSYTLCAAGGSGYLGRPQTYDVRWNIGPGPTQSTQLVLVAAKNISEQGNGFQQTNFFSIPITLRGLRGF
jgi:type IV pilus modification protein PilV